MARVRAIREALGLSQEAFAERAGLTYKHYQQVEAGRKLNITLPTLEKLAKGCGLELPELLDFKTDPVGLAEDRVGKSPSKSAKRRLGIKGT
jgi:transcriptional regulator with XRE-family HTH domain